MQQNILVTVFNVESEGYQAITELKQKFEGDSWFVSEAALIKKEAGTYKTIDLFDSKAHTADDTLIGGLIGMCVGVLGGPIGMLLGASYGALVGNSVDAIDTMDAVSLLEQIVGKLDDGMLALVALAEEKSPAALDAQFAKFDTIVARFDAAVVAQEVEKAREMEAEMRRLARLELRKQRTDEFKGKVEEKRAKLKARFAKE
ncbi:MAG: DUF1269 domain-containing protein [Lachnospiraceae bacterium]|nr:DUF1269 domain-containing protein [Lachnospiraceae bacterium]